MVQLEPKMVQMKSAVDQLESVVVQLESEMHKKFKMCLIQDPLSETYTV